MFIPTQLVGCTMKSKSKTKTLKKCYNIVTSDERGRLSDTESEDAEAQSMRGSRTDLEHVSLTQKEIRVVKRLLSTDIQADSEAGSPQEGDTRPALRTPAKVLKANDECNSLDDIHKLCTRLSRSKTDAIIKYVTALHRQNDEMATKIAKYEQELKVEAEINERLSRRIDNLEAGPTMAQVVAGPPLKKTKASAIRVLTKIIPTIKDKQYFNSVKIVPPPGTKNPDKAIQKVYNLAQYNIKISSLRMTSSNELIVRTETSDDAQRLMKSNTLAKNGYKVIPLKARNPKIIIFGTQFKTKDEVTDKIFEQNEDIAGRDADLFATRFVPLYSWSRNDKTTRWVVEVDPDIRKLIINTGRLYNPYQAHRVADFVYATRCYKCQKYGHVSKHCSQQKETCGHCAQQGHSFKDCPSKQQPAVCPNCKQNNLPTAHRVIDKNCQSFLRATKQQLLRTNYGQ